MNLSGLQVSILHTTIGCMCKHKKHYIYMSQDKLLKLLEKYHDQNPSRRKLNYHLSDLEKRGFIARTRRWTRRKDGTIRGLASMFYLGPSAFSGLRSLAKLLGRFFNLTDVQKAAHNCRLRLAIDFKKNYSKLKKKSTDKVGNKHPPPAGLRALGDLRERYELLKRQAQLLRERYQGA